MRGCGNFDVDCEIEGIFWRAVVIHFIVMCIEEDNPIIGEVEGGDRSQGGNKAILGTGVEFFGRGW